jgi:hypothetical protein
VRPEGGWYAPLAAVLCAAFLASASLLFVSMLGIAIGPFRFADMLRDDGRHAQRIGVWVPASTQTLVDALPAEDWRAALADAREVVEASTLEELRAVHADPIVVSDARALDAAELAALLAHVRAGGSVLLSGWIAVRDAHGRELDSAAMARLLDVERVATLRTSALAADARGPLVAGIAPGTILALPSPRLVPALAGESELCWVLPEPAAREDPCGALRLRRLGAGSLVWIAAFPGVMPADDVWQTLYRNALAAMLKRPVHDIVAGPDAPRVTRADVRSQLDVITERRMRLSISNVGTDVARGIVVRIYANRPLGGASARSSTLFSASPEVTRGAEHVDLRLPEIAAGESRTYVVDISTR